MDITEERISGRKITVNDTEVSKETKDGKRRRETEK